MLSSRNAIWGLCRCSHVHLTAGFSRFLSIFIYNYYACMMYTCTMAHVWKSEDHSVESVLITHVPVGSGHQTQSSGLVALSHLASPRMVGLELAS